MSTVPADHSRETSAPEARTRIGVIFGGRSSEREVSLAGGRNVVQHLDAKKFTVLSIFWDTEGNFWLIPEALIIRNTCKEIEERLGSHGKLLRYEDLPKTIDGAFLVTHGKFGDDGCLQGLFEFLHIPYTGSGVLGAALGMDKKMQRRLLADAKIPQPKYCVIYDWEWKKEKNSVNTKIEQEIGFPCVTKPTREGSTMGVCVNTDPSTLEQGVAAALQYDREVLVEPLIRGREFSCVVIGNGKAQALIPTETVHHEEIFTYDAKYLPGASKKITPMPVDPEILKTIQTLAERTYEALGFHSYARIDGFLTGDGRVLITDPNGGASTGMGPSSWTWHQAAEMGWSPTKFLSKILEFAFSAHQTKKGPL